MPTVTQRALAVAAYLALAACGGGGSTAPKAPGQGSTGSMTMSFVIPSATTTSSTARKPAYVSPSTASVVVTVSSGTTQPAFTTTANIGPGEPGCTTSASGTTCLVTVQAALGTDTFTIVDYSGTSGTGNILAEATFTQSVTAGMSPVGVTLSGVLSQVQLSLQTPALTAGTAATSILNVNGYDASGNLIAGPGNFSAPITVASDSTSVSLSGTSVTAPGQPITVTYAGGAAPYTVHFTATASGVSAGQLIGATLSIVPSQAFAIAGLIPGDLAQITSYAINALNDPPLTFSTLTLLGGSGYGFATSPNGGYALASQNVTDTGCVLQLYSASGTAVGAPLTYTNSGFPCVFTFDTAAGSGAGNLIAFDTASGNEFTEYAVNASGVVSTPTVRTIALGAAVPAALRSPSALVASQANGRLGFVTSGGAQLGVFAQGASGTVAPSVVTLASAGVAIAQSSAAGWYVLEQLPASPFLGFEVQNISGGAVVGSFTYSPPNIYDESLTGIAVDAAGEILVGATTSGNGGNSGVVQVFVFPAGTTGAATPTRTFGGSLTRNVTTGQAIGPSILASAPSVPTAATVSGDMLGYVASRAWTYQTTQNGLTSYFGIYADPQGSNGITSLVLFCALNNQTGCTSPNPFTGTSLGALGLQALPNGYLLDSFASASNNSAGVVPGVPLLVPNSLSLGQSWNPFGSGLGILSGLISANATVVAVGPVPGMSACPNSPTQGATVNYSITSSASPSSAGTGFGSQAMSFVPGCGITDFVNSAGQEFTLVSVGSQNLGTQDIARTTQSVSFMGTLRAMWQRLLVKHY